MVPVSRDFKCKMSALGFGENKFVTSLKIDPLLRSYQVSILHMSDNIGLLFTVHHEVFSELWGLECKSFILGIHNQSSLKILSLFLA